MSENKSGDNYHTRKAKGLIQLWQELSRVGKVNNITEKDVKWIQKKTNEAVKKEKQRLTPPK